MQVDEETSEDESEEEVRRTTMPFVPACRFFAYRLRSSIPLVPSSSLKRDDRWRNILFPGGISDRWNRRLGAYCIPLLFVFPCRAQKRIAQQRIDSKMPLGRIIDIRKKVFAEVKVCLVAVPIQVASSDILAELREPRFSDR